MAIALNPAVSTQIPKTLARSVLALAVVILAGCASAPAPVPPLPPAPPPGTPVPQVEPQGRLPSDPAVERAPEDRHPPMIRPTQAGASSTLAAVSSLVREGWAQYAAGQWHEAIATAERGLRIQRRVPELYLLLARAYLALDNPRQARSFARQGLRYSETDQESIRKQLEALLASTTDQS